MNLIGVVPHLWVSSAASALPCGRRKSKSDKLGSSRLFELPLRVESGLSRQSARGQNRTVEIPGHHKSIPRITGCPKLKHLMHISSASVLLLLIMLLSTGAPLIKSRTIRICFGVMLAIVIIAGIFGLFG